MFGMTVFESVLERLKAEARQAEEDAADEAADDDGPGEIRGLTSGFAGIGTGGTFVSGSQAAAAYLDLYEEPRPVEPEPQPAPEPPAAPPHLLRVAPEEIAEDLALNGKEGVDDLLARRRSFARENHPDRAPEDLRANATLRMKVANMLIDETIRRLKVEESLGLSR
ncbi:hypothetical protein GB928_021810 [Shinella curvata]|uniref:J domain-containing protein n=1 Tax=Shinella curvata TaxID=1817964 RepID=A0ABT8XJC2_9HYPH|nr:hypothetical protein [Shinella curvata]MCJ8052759.1 hypothetical protein [Shinella curvata]MDO6123839.1 hypothetical protein [Shinella curvata]